MARIPIAADVAELVGSFAEKIENRSLLLDKYSFHKSWPEEVDDHGQPVKWNEASRWSFLRVADRAATLLTKDAAEKGRRANGRDVGPQNRERYLSEAQIAKSLAMVSWDSRELELLRSAHTRRFLGLFRSAFGRRASITIGRLEGRMAINLANGLLENAGICLDRLFGLPYIPGSAVKGVCRHVALEALRAAQGDEQVRLFPLFRRVFGTADNDYGNKGDLREFARLLSDSSKNQKGAVSFLPAYPVNEAKLVVDLTNVHYPDYYRSGRVEDLGKEKPQPNPFPAVEAGAEFAFCLVLNGIDPDAGLLEEATAWLDAALTVRGMGAKTAAGYGWFSINPNALQQILDAERRETEAASAKARVEAEARAKTEEAARLLSAMPPEDQARERFKKLGPEEFATTATAISRLSAEEQKGFLLMLLTPEKRDTWKAWKKSDKPTNKTRVEAVRKAAQMQGINLP